MPGSVEVLDEGQDVWGRLGGRGTVVVGDLECQICGLLAVDGG